MVKVIEIGSLVELLAVLELTHDSLGEIPVMIYVDNLSLIFECSRALMVIWKVP